MTMQEKDNLTRQMDFNEREILGRKCWKNYTLAKHIPDNHLFFTPETYDGVDFYMTANTLCIGEIKYVTRPFTQYPNFAIDFNKLECLYGKYLDTGRTPLLVGFFTDRMIVWDLSKLDWYEDIQKKAYWSSNTRTTANGTYGKKTYKLTVPLFEKQSIINKIYRP